MNTLGPEVIVASVIGLLAITLFTVAAIIETFSYYEGGIYLVAGYICVLVSFGFLILAVAHQKAQLPMPNEMSAFRLELIIASVIGLIAIIHSIVALIIECLSNYNGINFFIAAVLCVFVALNFLITPGVHQKTQLPTPNENTTTTICEHNSDTKEDEQFQYKYCPNCGVELKQSEECEKSNKRNLFGSH